MDYSSFFKTVTGRMPFPYQARLGIQPWPNLLDVPTGLGKTAAVVVAWLYKRLQRDAETGTRLIYCLPMRVLVQQTAEAAQQWCERASAEFERVGLATPRVSVLLGGEIDEQWENAPEAPAILIGTQDLLLSRALNRGYAMSRYKWPMHFALLNNDCLWVYDETQLIGVGIETSAQLDGLRGTLGAYGPVRSLWMSATLGTDQLATVDHPKPPEGWVIQSLQGDDGENSLVQMRVGAKKPIQRLAQLQLDKSSDKSGYTRGLVEAVLEEHAARGGLTLVIVNRVQRAQELFRALRKRDGGGDENTALVHSRFRASERQQHEAVLKASERARIVVATQAVEAGVDVSARTLFTELAPWSSLVQRFGRCNRYGGEDAVIIWVDIDTKDPKGPILLPYGADDLNEARRLLKALQKRGADAGPENLKALSYNPPDVVRPVLRRKDLLDLFDTTPDLSGYDIDISRFVRDDEDTDVQFFWRDFEQEPTDIGAPLRDELCRVSVAAARDFIAKLKKRYDPSKPSTATLRAWRWNPLGRCWEQVTTVYSGQVLLLHVRAGGYDPHLGWTGEVAPKQPTTPIEVAKPSESFDADEGDPGSTFSGGRWVSLKDHLGHVRDEAGTLAEALSLEAQSEALGTAGLWHDVGKAHPLFQEKLLGPLKERPEALPQGEGPWAKSNHRLKMDLPRRNFRHELASALAWLSLATDQERPFADLVAYLIAAHHGKVRMSLRAMPDETKPEELERLYARGVWDGDELLPFTMPDGRRTRGVALDLSVMRLGRGSWLERVLALRDSPQLGPFRLAMLETVVRIADWRASEKEQRGGYDE